MYLYTTFYFIMKYIQYTAKTRMYIDKSTIYFSNGKQFCLNTIVLPVLPRNLGKIETSFSSKLLDFFIKGVRKPYPFRQVLFSATCHLCVSDSSDQLINQLFNV